ncbi:hypothetical protein ADK94_32420 [Streptomyces sp. XY593]|uniref:hypothetical protein n=1 Tax=Streptomyces sp. XY593 TaxID=1519483 RepID=UPI0006AF1D67|nr:hypothetical protein [Streptomyces sp. XY593]KOU79351.1 hypothetical protein ADK94_32420 [Streptomyces sp. XY593]
MMESNELRLLPWSGPDGRPSYLSADETGGYLSRLADSTEENQLGLGVELLAHAAEVLADTDSDPEEIRCLVADLASALRDAVRVASSRGYRSPPPASAPE